MDIVIINGLVGNRGRRDGHGAGVTRAGQNDRASRAAVAVLRLAFSDRLAASRGSNAPQPPRWRPEL